LFLKGLGGMTLGLPLLPSLASKAFGQVVTPPKYFVHFCTDHGGIWSSNMFPAAAASPQTQVYGGRTVKRAPLTLSVNSGTASLSPVLSAPSAVLTAGLAAKMNVIQGLDIPCYIAHHTGGHLGNFARNDGNGGDGTLLQGFPRRTIDQVMGWSPAFYPDLVGVRQRALTMGRRIAYNFANPAARTGAIQEIVATDDSLALFDQLFPPGTMQGPAPRPLIVDKVIDSYKRLRDGNRRLSVADKQRLDDHLQRLDELQRRLSVTAKPTCVQPARPPSSNYALYGTTFDVDPVKQATWHDLLNDVTVAAFACGLSRIATVKVNPTFSTYAGDWHQDIAHKADLPTGMAQGIISAAHQKFFQNVFLDLGRKLDAVSDGMGGTLLDHTLLVWTQESGNITHDNFSMPVITLGSAGGYFTTGSHVDYRNTTAALSSSATEKEYPGLFYQQWLGMNLRAFGIPQSEWAEPDHGGYGYRYSKVNFQQLTTQQAYPDSMWLLNGDPLPFLKA
jgi:hypothetical protein